MTAKEFADKQNNATQRASLYDHETWTSVWCSRMNRELYQVYTGSQYCETYKIRLQWAGLVVQMPEKKYRENNI